MDDRKLRIQNAVLKYSKSNSGIKTGRKNKSPEKEVVKELLNWLKDNKFDVHVVESKAVYSVAAGRYLSGQTDAGMSDIVGCTPEGVACFIEAKAKNKLSTLSLIQQDFLIKKATRGCFAIHTDSVERLKKIYEHWVMAREKNKDLATEYLLGLLHKI